MFTNILDLALSNFLSPVILFFILGFGARLLKSDLEIPGNVSKFIAIYLMMAIGYKGGYALSQYPIDLQLAVALIGGMLFSLCLPFLAYVILGAISRDLRPTDKAAISSHYGSVSVVTFVTAVDFLNIQNVSYDSWMVAVMASMETPAIFACFILVNKFAQNTENKVSLDTQVWKEIFLNGSVVLLIGSFVIAYIAGDSGMTAVEPFFKDIFKGVLCLFMIDIGMVAAARLGEKDSSLSPKIFSFGIAMPLIAAVLGGIFAKLIGLSEGNTMLFCVLCASASYIAVPAALRVAMPQVNLSPPLTLSLAITFPFNIIIGLPLYLTWAKFLTG